METIKIATWNTQGNAFAEGKINRLIRIYDPDIICLQECGNLLSRRDMFPRFIAKSPINHGTYKSGSFRGKEFNVFYYPWNGACRCSMAIMVKTKFNISNYSLVSFFGQREETSYNDNFSETSASHEEENYVKARMGIRSMLRVNIEYMNDEISINNVHLPSGCPSFARKVGYTFIDDCFKRFPRNIIIVGDMNTPPELWRYPYSLRVSAPNDRTHSGGNTLDYMITNMHKLNVKVDDKFNSSDHLAVFYELQLTC